MIISAQDKSALTALAHGEGAVALEYLAKLLYDYYAHEVIIAEKEAIYRHQGAALLAEWLTKLPKGLRENGNGPISSATATVGSTPSDYSY